MKKIIAFGEVLYDVFDGGANAEIGGAPFNFCAGVARLGDEGYLLSAVGSDEPGKRVTQEYCKSFGVKTELVSVISKPTGVCLVTRGADGEPTYDLKYDAAYDNIPTPEKPLCADLFYFGTLAQRSVVSRKTLYNVLENGRFGEVFFDVNLRMNFFDEEIIRRGLEYATILKVNLDECHYLCKIGICRSKEPHRENIQSLSNCAAALMSDFDLNCVIITLDKDGAFAGRKQNGKIETAIGSAKACKNVSAVGAGDAFSAAFVHNFLGGASLPDCVRRACILGAYTVGFDGALPVLSDDVMMRITQ